MTFEATYNYILLNCNVQNFTLVDQNGNRSEKQMLWDVSDPDFHILDMETFEERIISYWRVKVAQDNVLLWDNPYPLAIVKEATNA